MSRLKKISILDNSLDIEKKAYINMPVPSNLESLLNENYTLKQMEQNYGLDCVISYMRSNPLEYGYILKNLDESPRLTL